MKQKKNLSKKNNAGKIGIIVIISIVAFFVVLSIVGVYLTDYSKATQTAKNAMYGDGNLLVEEDKEYLYFSNEEEKMNREESY